MNYVFAIFAFISMGSCDFSKPVVNIHLKKNQEGWCFVLLDSNKNLPFESVISVELDNKFNATCINKKYNESRFTLNVYNSKGQLINDKLKLTALSGYSDGKKYIEFYVPSKKEENLPAEYWIKGNSKALLIDKSISLADEIFKADLCN